MILDGIICPSRKPFRNQRPTITEFFMSFNDSEVFFFGPTLLLDIGIEMVVPSLPTLLTDTARKVLCNVTPISRAIFTD